MTPKRRRKVVPEHPGAEAGEGREAPPEAAGRPTRSIDILEIAHGEFDAIARLNPSFRPGVARLKLTLRIEGAEDRPGPGVLVDLLTEFLPSLSTHRCCGENSVKETFFERGRRRRCAMEAADEGVDLAHLVEHVMIDVQHFIARMKTCSGVTCAWASPPDLYDIFVEAPEEAVGRLSAGLAVDLVNDLIARARPDPRYLCVMHVARVARDHGGWPINPHLSNLGTAWGRHVVSEAVGSLRRRGFLSEIPASFNFSGEPLLTYAPLPAPAEVSP